MARYAGSRLNLSDFDFSGAGGGPGIAQAAGLAQLGATAKAYADASPDTGDLMEGLIAARNHEEKSKIAGELSAAKGALTGYGRAALAKQQGEAGLAQEKSNTFGTVVKTGLMLGLNALSDETTKNTITKIEDALTVLRELKPVSFYYNEEYSSSPERLHYGFVAQDYQKVMPDATYYDESIGKLCIDTNELIGLLVRSVQQLETRLARMEAKEALAGVK